MVDTTKPVDRTGNTFCGPLVLAAILGTSTGKVADTIANMRRSKDAACKVDGRIRRMPKGVRGTFNQELFAVLERSGLHVEPVDIGARYKRMRKAHARTDLQVYISADAKRWLRPPSFMTVDANAWHPVTMIERQGRPLWVALHSSLNDGGTYVVNTPGHWAIVSDRKWCETHTRGQWVPFYSVPRSRRVVLNAWRVSA